MAAHLLGCSLGEDLDNRRSWKSLKRRLTEAVSRQKVDIHLSREWTHFNGFASFFFTVIVRRFPLPRNCSTRFVIPGYAIDQSCIDVKKVDPHFVVATLICAPDAERVVRRL